MNGIGLPERATQNRVVALFRDELGYRYLGDWSDRIGNSNIDSDLLTQWLSGNGHSPEQISRAIYLLRTEASNYSRGLYQNNRAVYSMLRYGVPVKVDAGNVTESIHLINWDQPEKNDFAVAEEVAISGNYNRRPDLVLYVNGIAIGVIELKNSRVSIGDGIRQNLSNQQPEFNAWFFSPSNSFLPVTIPKVFVTGRPSPRRSTFSTGKKTSWTTRVSSSTSIY